MLTERGQNKLKAEHKRIVKHMFALGESCKDIVDHLKLEHEISVHPQTVYWYSWNRYESDLRVGQNGIDSILDATSS